MCVEPRSPHHTVGEGEVPVPSSKLSSCLDRAPPFSLCSLTRTWKTKKQHIAGRQGRSAGQRNTSPVFALPGTEKSWTIPISFLSLLYSAVLTPASLGKARVVGGGQNRKNLFSQMGCELCNDWALVSPLEPPELVPPTRCFTPPFFIIVEHPWG